MSSCNWKKLHGPHQTKAMLRHNDKDLRLKNPHSNMDIDKTKTHLNMNFTGMNYRQEAKTYDNRLKEVTSDRKRPLRRDAVTCISLNIKLPAGMLGRSYEEQQEWARRCFEVVSDFVGQENVISGTADFDEIHKYRDKKTHEWKDSRPEVDVRFVPAVDGKLVGTKFACIRNMVDLNDAVEKMSVEEFDCPFMTGEKLKNGESAEELKLASRIADLEEQVRTLEETRESLQNELNDLKEENDRLRHFNASESDSERQIEGVSERAESSQRGKQAEDQLGTR